MMFILHGKEELDEMSVEILPVCPYHCTHEEGTHENGSLKVLYLWTSDYPRRRIVLIRNQSSCSGVPLWPPP